LPNPNSWYKVPTPRQRFLRYVNGVVGPLALAKYAGSAGITSWRKTPSEWGDNWAGFGRRYANVLAKSAISRTTTYALDEALKVDSSFYYSQNRSVSARLRNSIFSPFTARDRSGRRVAGIPRLAGLFASNVISSQFWYPKRFDYVHGLKGVPISLAFNAGFNIFKEFVLKK
jgi:hypothetical protein